MPKLPALLGAAALALAAAAGLSTAASADHGDRYRWNGPQGYFVVSARACPDLREDLRDRRGYGHQRRSDRYDRYDRRGYGDRHARGRDQQVLNCPAHAWSYVPSPREGRMARYGHAMHPTRAYFDPRQGHYHVTSRWGEVPVRIDWRGVTHGGRGHHGYTGTGLSFEFRF